jgi:hypothetical protein
MLLITVQLLVVFLECLFLRTCTRIVDSGRKVPRLILLLSILLSLVPGLGIVVAVTIFIVVIINLSNNNLGIKDNRFTRFWLN